MGTEQPPDDGSPQGNGVQRKPMSPAKRKRLQQCFEHANKMMAQDNFDYALTLLTTCVSGDPSDLQFLLSFLGSLKKKYNNNKKGDNLAFIKGASVRRTVAKAESQQDWDGVIKTGLEALKLNPWDVQVLTKMAAACKEMAFDEVELAYLKTALEANPKDYDVNWLCAMALKERKQFDQAIACLHRCEQARPGDEQAQRAIASLAVEKTISQGGYDDNDPMKKKISGQSTAPGAAAVYISPIERLERDIKRKPDDVPKYLELADLYFQEDMFDKAEEVLGRAYEASGHDTDVREKWEDAQLRCLRQEYTVAKNKVEESPTDEGKLRLKDVHKRIMVKELEVYQNRCERYPNNLSFKYDLGLRYQLNGRYNEAIAEFQQARNDPRRKGLCLLHLGQCFQQIKQLRLAISHYEEATVEIPERDPDHKKQSLYLAGKLAFHLRDYDVAERHLTSLAARDFGYKDVPKLLDEIAEARERPGDEGGELREDDDHGGETEEPGGRLPTS